MLKFLLLLYALGIGSQPIVTKEPGLTGWQYLQVQGRDGLSGNSPAECTQSGVNTCTFAIFPTTAGSIAAITVYTGGANVTISSASISGGTCTTTSGANHVFDGTNSANLDAIYCTGYTAGTTSATVTLSGNVTGSFSPLFWEVMPPTGYTPSFDAGATAHSAACTSCTVAKPTISSTDAVITALAPQFGGLSQNNAFQYTSPPFIQSSFLGNSGSMGFNISTMDTATFANGTSGFFNATAISFKSSAGKFVTPTPVYSIVATTPDVTEQMTCTPVCPAVTGLPSTGSGHLIILYVTSPSLSTSNLISSVSSAAGTFVVPAGAARFVSGTGSVSVAYVLSSSSGATGFTLTMNNSAGTTETYWGWLELSRSDGKAFTLDTDGCVTNSSASLTPPGVALTLSGRKDVLFQMIESNVDNAFDDYFYTQTLYNQPAYAGGANTDTPGYGSSALLLDSANGAALTWAHTISEASVGCGIAWK